MKRRLTALCVGALLVAPQSHSAAQTPAPSICLDVQPEHGDGARTGSPFFLTVTLRERSPADEACTGPTPEDADLSVSVNIEMTGVNDVDANSDLQIGSDSPQSPDGFCSIETNYYTDAHCVFAVWGDDEGTETIRAWIDADHDDPPTGIVEADRTEGTDESVQPGDGCTGLPPDVSGGEPDCTDVVDIEWVERASCDLSRAHRRGYDRIAATIHGRTDRSRLMTYRSDGTKERRVVAPEDLRLTLWSPDHERIVFATGYINRLELWVTKADGSHRIRLTDNGRIDEDPAWSPDSKRIVYSGYHYGYSRERPSQLSIVEADGSRTEALTKGWMDSTHPDWSPDGKRIVFSRYHIGYPTRGGLFSIRPDGSGLKRLIWGRTIFEYPQYSPDGSQILFRRPVPGYARDLFVMRADGTHIRRITRSPKRTLVTDFQWSPNGQRIVYQISSTRGWDQIRVTSADGSNDRRLVRFFGEFGLDLSLSWSPDSAMIAYNLAYRSWQRGDWRWASDVWLTSIDGGCSEVLRTSPHRAEFEPSWITPASSANPSDL